MSSTSLFNLIFLILLFSLLSCQSVEKVIDQNFNKEKKIPEISNIENVDNIQLGSSIFLNNFEKKINLSGIKHAKNWKTHLYTNLAHEFECVLSTAQGFRLIFP